MLLATMYFFSENKNLFKNLNSLNCAKYHLSKNLRTHTVHVFWLTWENAGCQLQVFTVFQFQNDQYSEAVLTFGKHL